MRRWKERMEQFEWITACRVEESRLIKPFIEWKETGKYPGLRLPLTVYDD